VSASALGVGCGSATGVVAGHPNFEFFQKDVVLPFFIEVDRIYHLACPASPPHYQANPIKTIKCSTMGCLNMLGLAKRCKARLLFTSTSEIYGDPLEHPQRETYWGNVHTWGPRACYDEGKRIGETMCYSYREQHGVQVRVARIFNTYGPRMDPFDGRVVSNFVIQALKGEDLTLYGTGKQTRSFQYVSDLVRGLVSLMEGEYSDPVNLGNPEERSIGEFAELVAARCGATSKVVYKPKPEDDPMVRRPCVELARRVIGWQPRVPLEEGLTHTIEYFKGVLGHADAKIPADNVWLPSTLQIPTVASPDPVARERVVADAPVASSSSSH
jgi:UDP-glucuronate decarboxylase